MELFRLFGSILVDNEEANRSISATDDRARGMGATFADGIKTVGAWGMALGGAAIAGGAALLGIASAASDTASRVQDMSAKIGMSTQGFQEWDYLLSQSGVDIGVLQGGFKKFAGVIDEATAGGKNQVAMFKELGISLTDTNGKVKSTEQLFNESVTAFTGMEAGAHKSALAADIFGKSSTEMGAILNGTAADITAAKDRANELGLVLSEDAIAAGDNFGDTMDNVKKSLSAIVTVVGVEVMPIIQQFMDWIIVNMPMIKQVASDTFAGIKTYVMLTVDAVVSLTKFFQEHWGVIEPILAGIGAGALTFGLYTLAMNAASIATGVWTTVTGVATAVGTAFGAVLAFITSPIGLVVIAIGLLVAAGVLLYRNWDTVKTFLNDTWQTISNTATSVFNGFLEFFKKWGGLLLVILTGPFGLLVVAIARNWDDIKLFLETTWNRIKETAVTVFTAIKDWFVEWGPLLLVVITGPIGLIVLAVAKNWETIKTKTIEIFNSISTWISEKVTFIQGIFTGAVETFKKVGGDIFNGLFDGIKGVWTNISNYISEKVNWLADKLSFWKSSQSQMSGGGSAGLPARASGGPVIGGQAYLVGEKGPEIFTASQSGTIIPNNKISSGGTSININISGNSIMGDSDADKFGDLIVRRLKTLGVT